MSTTVTVDGADALRHAMNLVRSNESKVQSYVLVGHHERNPNVISIRSTGTGITTLVKQLKDDEVLYALIKMEEQIDMSVTTKYVYVHWIGENVPFSKKGRYGVVHGSVQDQIFRPSHFDIETSSADDISEENFTKIITETSGTKSKVIANDTSLPKRGFTSVPTSQPPKSRGPVIPVSSAGAEVKYGDDVSEAICDVRSDESDITWVCIGYTNNDVKKPLCFVDKGSGGIEELKSLLDEGKPLYFLYRTTDTIDGHVTVKFVYVAWLGECVKPMAKAKLATHKGVVQEIFSGCHVSLFCTNKGDLSEHIVADKVQSASGSKSHVK